MAKLSDFDASVPLPTGLGVAAIRRAIEYVEKALAELVELYYELANVFIWRVDVIFLSKADWKYEKSTAGESGGGRTHTFGVKAAARKLACAAVYRRKDVVICDGKPIPKNGSDESGG
ncbi:MAG: hypothetical protein CHACPFDD_01826 [Phycisphaerae bacterium]|nr:hypothetical protein [Phycisphaerae bacterium]